MPILRNICPRGDRDLPLLRRVVARGEEFECTPEQAARLLEQTDNYEPVDDAAKAILAELTTPADAEQAPPPDPADTPERKSTTRSRKGAQA